MEKIYFVLVTSSLLLQGLTAVDAQAQPTYTPWQTIYEEGSNEGDFRVQVSFKLSQKDCKYSPNSYYRTNVSRSKPKAYLNFSFKYKNCDGSIKTETPTVDLNKVGVREGGGMWFLGKQLVGSVYSVKMDDYGSKEKPKSNSGSSEITFPTPSSQNNNQRQQEENNRRLEDQQRADLVQQQETARRKREESELRLKELERRQALLRQQEEKRHNAQKQQVVGEYNRIVNQNKATQDAINTLGNAAQDYIKQRYEEKKRESERQVLREKEKEEADERREEREEQLAEIREQARLVEEARQQEEQARAEIERQRLVRLRQQRDYIFFSAKSGSGKIAADGLFLLHDNRNSSLQLLSLQQYQPA